MMDQHLTVREAAALFNMSPRTIYRHVWAGDIPHRRVGRQIRIPKADLLSSLQVKGGIYAS